jgi:hypothetical protein
MGKGQKAFFVAFFGCAAVVFSTNFFSFPATKFISKSGRFLPRLSPLCGLDLGTKSSKKIALSVPVSALSQDLNWGCACCLCLACSQSVLSLWLAVQTVRYGQGMYA